MKQYHANFHDPPYYHDYCVCWDHYSDPARCCRSSSSSDQGRCRLRVSSVSLLNSCAVCIGTNVMYSETPDWVAMLGIPTANKQ